MTDEEKLRVLLPHWIEHNAEHAAEFRRWSTTVDAAKVGIEEAAALVETANERLEAALKVLGGPLDSNVHGHDHAHGHEHGHHH